MAAVSPLHMIAASLGAEPDGPSECSVCGESPYRRLGGLRQTLGPMFTNFSDLVDRASDAVCAGCKLVLSGRPGREPPPLRMVSFAVTGGEFRPLRQPDFWDLVSAPPDDGIILSWGRSRKKQHALHAGISAAGVWRVGTDDGPAIWKHDPALPEAIARLRRMGISKGAILTGRYPTARALECVDAESVVGLYRGTLALDVMVHCAPEVATGKHIEKGGRPMLADEDIRAAELLAAIARGSQYRREEGLRFWGGYYLARIRRFSRLPMPDFASRMLAECQCVTRTQAEVAALVRDTEDTAPVMRAIQERHSLLHGLSFEMIQEEKTNSKRREKADHDLFD